jgi:outer membrane protein TolC
MFRRLSYQLKKIIKKMMNNILFTLLIVLNTIFLNAQITLEKCISLAEKNTPSTQLLLLVAETEALQINALNKNLLPQTSIGGQASWQSTVTGLTIKLPNIEIKTIPKDQYKATFDINQTIWDGGQLKSQKKLATANANVETKNIENSIYQIKEQVSNLYFGALLADKQYVSAEITKNDLENQLKKLTANVQNGLAIKSNVWALEAKLIELSQFQREIKSRKIAALNSLTILTGIIFNENTFLEQPSNSVNDSENINRPELKVFESQQNLAEANKSVINSRYTPKLNLFGTGGYGRPGLNFLSPDFKTYFIGGLNLRIPISQFYTKSKDSDFRQIDINKLKIDKQKELFLQQISLKLSNLNEDASKISDQIIEDKKLVEIREQIKKSAQNRLDNGVITLSDFLTEVDNEAMAKQNMILHQIQLLQVKNAINITKGN